MNKYLRLVRIQNVIGAVLVMYSIRLLLLQPLLNVYGLSFASTEFEFAMMVISVAFLTAAAGIINDYFDRKADLLNHPEKVVLVTKVNRRFAIILHGVLNFIGIFAGFFVTYKSGSFTFGYITILMTALFYLHAAVFKKKFIVGTLLISLIIAGVSFLPWVAEYSFAVLRNPSPLALDLYDHLQIFPLGFSITVFILNLAREVSKDLISFRGDFQSGSKTMPILFGKKKSRYFISIVLFLIVVLTLTEWFFYLRDMHYIKYQLPTFLYLLVLIIMPCLFLGMYAVRMKGRRQYAIMVKSIQLLMSLVVMFAAVFYINLMC